MKEVSEGLYCSASSTSGKEDGQEELSDLNEPCGQEDPCHTVPCTVLPPLRSPSPRPDATPAAQGDEEQLLKDCHVTQKPNVLSYLSAPNGTWMKAGFGSTTSGNNSLPLAAAAAGSP